MRSATCSSQSLPNLNRFVSRSSVPRQRPASVVLGVAREAREARFMVEHEELHHDSCSFDKSQVRTVSDGHLQIVNDAAFAMMISLGHRTGLLTRWPAGAVDAGRDRRRRRDERAVRARMARRDGHRRDRRARHGAETCPVAGGSRGQPDPGGEPGQHGGDDAVDRRARRRPKTRSWRRSAMGGACRTARSRAFTR